MLNATLCVVYLGVSALAKYVQTLALFAQKVSACSTVIYDDVLWKPLPLAIAASISDWVSLHTHGSEPFSCKRN